MFVIQLAELRLAIEAIDRVSACIRALPLPVEETITLYVKTLAAAAEIPFVSKGGEVVVVRSWFAGPWSTSARQRVNDIAFCVDERNFDVAFLLVSRKRHADAVKTRRQCALTFDRNVREQQVEPGGELFLGRQLAPANDGGHNL